MNGSAPLRDLSASPDADIVRRVEQLQTSLKTSQAQHTGRPVQFVGYVTQTGADKRFGVGDGMKVMHVSKELFGVYRVPVIAAPELRRVFSKLHAAVLASQIAAKTRRPLRAHEVELVDNAFALLEDIQEELKKC